MVGISAATVAAVREHSHRPLILIGEPDELKTGLTQLDDGEKPLLCQATAENWEAMAKLAVEYGAALAVEADSIDEMVDLVGKARRRRRQGPGAIPHATGFHGTLTANTVIRRMAFKKNFRPLGYPDHQLPRRRWRPGA